MKHDETGITKIKKIAFNRNQIGLTTTYMAVSHYFQPHGTLFLTPSLKTRLNLSPEASIGRKNEDWKHTEIQGKIQEG